MTIDLILNDEMNVTDQLQFDDYTIKLLVKSTDYRYNNLIKELSLFRWTYYSCAIVCRLPPSL